MGKPLRRTRPAKLQEPVAGQTREKRAKTREREHHTKSWGLRL
jgi:hypothetical protein